MVGGPRTNSLKTREIGRTAKSLSPSNRKLLHSFGQLDRHSPAIGTADFIAAVFKSYWLALVAQLDRASDYESEGQEFESLRARQIPSIALHSTLLPPKVRLYREREMASCELTCGLSARDLVR